MKISEKILRHTRKADTTLVALVVLLMIAGLVLLYSTSAYNGRVKFNDPAYYFKKQLFAGILGFVGMYLISSMDYHRLLKYAPWLYLLSLGLSTAVLFVGSSINGSRRWLTLGPLSFQPSEFAKVAVILFLTWMAEKTKQKLSGWKFMVMVFVGVLPIVALVGSNNLSTAVIILGIAVILIFVTNPRYLPFMGVAGAGTVLVAVFLSLESYRLERLAIWRNPEAYEKGFQTIQGLYAIGSGGIFGKGIGSSLQKLGFVPEAQNDMIFSIICEETGLGWRMSCDPGFRSADLAADGHRCSCPGPGGNLNCVRNYGTYSHPGHTEHCRCHQYDPQYGNYPSVYQLRRDFRRLSAGGNGACPFGYAYEKIAVSLAER